MAKAGTHSANAFSSEGDQVTSSLLISGMLPALLKEDPRYFRRGVGSPWSRTWYAVERTVITRKDDGRPTFNTSSSKLLAAKTECCRAASQSDVEYLDIFGVLRSA